METHRLPQHVCPSNSSHSSLPQELCTTCIKAILPQIVTNSDLNANGTTLVRYFLTTLTKAVSQPHHSLPHDLFYLPFLQQWPVPEAVLCFANIILGLPTLEYKLWSTDPEPLTPRLLSAWRMLCLCASLFSLTATRPGRQSDEMVHSIMV